MKISLAAFTAALAVAAVAPAAALADALTYADGNNVWVASADGGVKRQLTSDGSSGSYYAFPSLDDAGDVVSIKGASTTRAIKVIGPDGSTKAMNVMPWKTGLGNIGPISGRVKPTTGSLIAYGYFLNHGPYSGYPNGGLEHRLAIVTPMSPGSPTNPMVDQPGKDNPTWHGDRLVVGSGGDIHIETQPLQFQFWLNDDTANLNGAEVSRGGDRVLVAYSDGRLALLAYQGAIPGGTVTDGCYLPVNGQAADGPPDWALSPDGRRVAWTDSGGLHVASTEPHPGPGGGPCALSSHTVLSAGGKQPAFSAAPAPSNGTAVGESKAPGGTGGNPSVATLTVRGVGASVTRTALRRGLKVSTTVTGPGTVTAALLSGGTLATAKARPRKAGKVALRLRLTKAGKRRIGRLAGKRVKLRVTFTPSRKGVKKATGVRTIKVR